MRKEEGIGQTSQNIMIDKVLIKWMKIVFFSGEKICLKEGEQPSQFNKIKGGYI